MEENPLSYLLRTAYRGFTFRPDSRHYHPTFSLLIIIIQFILLLQDDLLILALAFVLVLLESAINGFFKDQLQVMKGITPLILFIGTILFLFSGVLNAIRIIFRILIGATMFSFFFSVTNPSNLTRSLEAMKVPSKIAIIPALTMTLIPRIAKDAEETLHALSLRDEIQGIPIKWMPKMLAIFIASVLYRAEFLSQSLYYRGFGTTKRTHHKKLTIHVRDWIRLFFWTIIGLTIWWLRIYQNCI